MGLKLSPGLVLLKPERCEQLVWVPKESELAIGQVVQSHSPEVLSGQRVFYYRLAGIDIEIGNTSYRLVSSSDILAIYNG